MSCVALGTSKITHKVLREKRITAAISKSCRPSGVVAGKFGTCFLIQLLSMFMTDKTKIRSSTSDSTGKTKIRSI